MKKILVLLLFGLALFGCLGPSTPSGGGTTGGGTTGGGTTGGGTGGISTYSAAAAAGVPLQCTVTAEGTTTTIFIKGNNMYMSGTSGGQPYELITKGNTTYWKLSDEMKQSFQQSAGKSCDWLMMEQEGQAQGGGTPVSPPTDTGAYTGPTATWSCSAGVFGDEKFNPSGSACTIQDLTGGYAAQNPPAQ